MSGRLEIATDGAANIGDTRRVLTAICHISRRHVATLDDLAHRLARQDLDAATLGDIAEILDAAAATAAAAETALNGLNTRHSAIEEAIATSGTRPAVSSGSAIMVARATPRTDGHSQQSAVHAPVSFADADKETRLEAMRAEIDTALEKMADPVAWQTFLESLATFHRYSVNNTLLALLQRPNATRLAGFKDWKKKHSRTVRKGEKAIWILAPMTYKVTEPDPASGKDKTLEYVKGFRPVPVFDVAQTEGEPLPAPPIPEVQTLDGDAPAGMHDNLIGQITQLGYSTEFQPLAGADGYTDPVRKAVVIEADTPPRQQALTLAHELAHITLGHTDNTRAYHIGQGGQRREMEIEAESVAYVVARHHGITDAGRSSFGYIATWARGDTKKVRQTAERVLAAARTILDAATTGEQK